MSSYENVERITINSVDKVSGDNINSCRFRLKHKLTNIKHIIVNNITMYHTEYTLNSNNESLTFKHTDGLYYTPIFQHGFYSIGDLLEEINIKVNLEVVVGGDIYTNGVVDEAKCFYWFKQDTKTKKIILDLGGIGNTTPTPSVFYFGNNVVYDSPAATANNVGQTLGFINGAYDFAITTNNWSKKIPSLSTKYYEFRSDIILNNLYDSAGKKPVLGKVNQLVNDGELNFETSLYPVKLTPRHSELQEFTISVYNDRNKLAIINDDYVIDLWIIRS